MMMLSEQEKQERRESNEDVLGTHAMEGLFPDQVTSALLSRYAEGEFTHEELSARIDTHVADLLARKSIFAGAA